jgi:isoleucyl-tRNA synthetase
MQEIDLWVLSRTEKLVADCLASYQEFGFHKVYRAVYDFATTDLSAIYFDAAKDRLYTAAPKSRSRRSAQTAVHRITYALVRLIAPLLAFTTEEVWSYLRKPEGSPDSVHLALFPQAEELTAGFTAQQRSRLRNWDELIAVRDVVLKQLEVARQDKFIGAPLEARVRLKASDKIYALLEEYLNELPGLFIVSQVALDRAAGDDLSVEIERAQGEKCERCWKYTTDVGEDPDFPTVCAACKDAVKEILGE